MNEQEKLADEIRKLDMQIEGMGAKERARRVDEMRKRFRLGHLSLTDSDESILRSFVNGDCQLEELARHFEGRL